MRKTLLQALLIGLFLGATTLTGLAASDPESQLPGATAPPAVTHPGGMMGPGGMGMGQMPGMAPPASGSMLPMMGQGMGKMMGGMSGMMGQGMSGMMEMMGGGDMGMMQHHMDHQFYLDRADELGLSKDQVKTLKTLQLECRKDNIRTAAEAKIARIELNSLLSGNDWKLKDAKDSVRKLQQLEGDIQVRHLQALDAARRVLTDKQLQQAQTGDNSENAEGLFQ